MCLNSWHFSDLLRPKNCSQVTPQVSVLRTRLHAITFAHMSDPRISYVVFLLQRLALLPRVLWTWLKMRQRKHLDQQHNHRESQYIEKAQPEFTTVDSPHTARNCQWVDLALSINALLIVGRPGRSTYCRKKEAWPLRYGVYGRIYWDMVSMGVFTEIWCLIKAHSDEHGRVLIHSPKHEWVREKREFTRGAPRRWGSGRYVLRKTQAPLTHRASSRAAIRSPLGDLGSVS